MFRNSIVPITAGVMLALAGSAQAAGTKTDHIRRQRPTSRRTASSLGYRHGLRRLRRQRRDRFGRHRRRPLQQERRLTRSPWMPARRPAQLRSSALLSVRRRNAGVQPVHGRGPDLGVGRHTLAPALWYGTGTGLGDVQSRTPCTASCLNNAANQAAAVGAYTRHRSRPRSPTDRTSHALPASHGKRPRVGGSPVAAAGVGRNVLDLAAAGGTVRPGHDRSTDGTQRGRRASPVQVETLVWSQAAGEDKLEPTKDLLVSPTVFTLPPRGSQLVRVALQAAARTRPGNSATA